MKSIVPKGTHLAQLTHDFLSQSSKLAAESCEKLEKSESYPEIFRTALASEAVFKALKTRRLQPDVASLRNTSLRVPLLIALGQTSLAKVELRRFLELVFWIIYFTHHPKEWEHFDGRKGMGFTRDHSKPIGFAAHRELSFYFLYAAECMAEEPSGQALLAISALEGVKKDLNSAVHAGQIARVPESHIPFDSVDEKDLKKFLLLQKQTLSNSIVLLAAFNRAAFDKMPAGAKAYFDWLVGSETKKAIQKGPFGLTL